MRFSEVIASVAASLDLGSFNLGSMANAMPQALGASALDRHRPGDVRRQDDVGSPPERRVGDWLVWEDIDTGGSGISKLKVLPSPALLM